MTRFAVIGDIHGNEQALDAALSATDEMGFDQRVFIGDLLTYGTSVTTIVEKMAKLSQDGNTTVLRGNHDLIYDQLLKGNSSYKDSLPSWLQNSIDITFEQLEPGIWAQVLFQDNFVNEAVYFSHANPFGRHNWRYLNTQADMEDAANTLHMKQACVGVFGHTHRIAIFHGGVHQLPLSQNDPFLENLGVLNCNPVVLNCGSVGQPRDKNNREHVLWVETSAQAVKCWFQPIFYEVEGHLADLEESTLIAEAKRRIRAFHIP